MLLSMAESLQLGVSDERRQNAVAAATGLTWASTDILPPVALLFRVIQGLGLRV